MRDRASLFARWRGSIAGAWLAMAYALAVLASALAVPGRAETGPDGAQIVLCSGAMLAGDPADDAQGAAGHCQGCPAMPAVGLPPSPGFVAFAPRVCASERSAQASGVLAHGFPLGLANPRAPPAA